MEKTEVKEAEEVIPQGDCCYRCRFRLITIQPGSTTKQYFCRRHAPHVTSMVVPVQNPITKENGFGVNDRSAWPLIQQTDWCGDFDIDNKR